MNSYGTGYSSADEILFYHICQENNQASQLARAL